MSIQIREVNLDTTEYEAERDLRNRVLLRPIGLPDHHWEMKDKESVHIGCFDDKQLVGCVLLWPSTNSPTEAQLLQMAVEPERQGQGLGYRLIEGLEQVAVARGIRRVWCHARSMVIPFYLKSGFVCLGDTFQEVGLDHIVMERHLALDKG